MEQQKMRPTHILKKRDGESLVEITGLYPREGKKGTKYLSRYVKDSKKGYMVFDRDPAKGDGIAALFIKGEGQDKLGDAVDVFTKTTSKSGVEYLAGSNGYMIFPNDVAGN